AVVMVPLLACATFYTLEKLEGAATSTYVVASLAFPVMLLGLMGVAHVMISNNKIGWCKWLSGLAIVIACRCAYGNLDLSTTSHSNRSMWGG
ncbi:MAG: hypothetical protein AAGF06_07620, partial [Pseudomonadota bacterium]